MIIAPSSVKFMWKESAKRWLPNTLRRFCESGEVVREIDDCIQVMENGRQQVHANAKIVVASYDLVARNVKELSERTKFKVIICDECHLLKSMKAARTKAVIQLIHKPHCQRAILLSGTPALSRPAELYSQIFAVSPTMFASFHEFGMRYCDGKESRFGWDFSGYSNMNELRVLLEERLLIRREKKDVIQQLPAKMREMCVLNPALIELNSKTLSQASEKLTRTTTSGKASGSEQRGAMLQYFRETSVVKAKAVCEFVNDLLESDKKFLVFAHHQCMLDELENECCKKNNYEYIRIDGSTSSEKRKQLVDKFQNTDACQVALLSITAASTGITLTEASLVV